MRSRRRVLAVASGGGHWVQLLRLRKALDEFEVVYACVDRGYATQVPGHRFHKIHDANRWNRWGLVRLALEVLGVLLRERPDVVISTGAAPGFLALRLGKLMGARTIWVDSIANAEELSLSGRRIGPHADLWLTQWKPLSTPEGPDFRGAVL